MRRFLIFVIITLVICGNAWGQIPRDDKLFFDFYEQYSNRYFNIFDLTDLYSAVPTISTEARYSALQFGSNVDSFIDTRGYNPAIGTFFFMGGFPSQDYISTTNYLTPGSQMSNPFGSFFFPGGSYAFSAGFGKTISDNIYIAAYFGGSLISAYGHKTDNVIDPEKADTYSYGIWRNNLAVLFGISDMGFRLDLIMNNPESQTITIEDDKQQYIDRNFGISLALSWGMGLGNFSPHAKFGLTLSDSTTITIDDGKKMTRSPGGKWAFIAGTGYNLPSSGSVWTDFLLGGQFQGFLSGDSKEITDVDPFRGGGSFGIGVKSGYSNSFAAGKYILNYSPNIKIGSTYLSQFNETLEGSENYPFHNFIDISLGMDIGLRFKPNNKFAFYTGVGLGFFELTYWNLVFGKDDYKSNEVHWQIYGIEWDSSRTLAGGELGFGMTFKPNDYVSIGFGLNSILDKLFQFNIRKMTIETGSFWNTDYDSLASWASGFMDFSKLDLTISITIPPGGIQPIERRSFQDYLYDIKFIRDIRDFREFRAGTE